MHDVQIRLSVECELRRLHIADPSTKYQHELGLCMGRTRVDVAAINGHLTGCEIKSARDRLTRLPRQVELYSKVLDVAIVVTEGKYADHVADFLPSWWGLWRADNVDGEALLSVLRPPGINPGVDPFSVAQLLWRDEAMAELKRRDAARGLSGRARHHVWTRLVEVLEVEDVKSLVRRTLKERQPWSADQ